MSLCPNKYHMRSCALLNHGWIPLWNAFVSYFLDTCLLLDMIFSPWVLFLCHKRKVFNIFRVIRDTLNIVDTWPLSMFKFVLSDIIMIFSISREYDHVMNVTFLSKHGCCHTGPTKTKMSIMVFLCPDIGTHIFVFN